MQKLPFLLMSVAVSGAMAMVGIVPKAYAQSQTGVSLSCGTNFCQASVSSPGSPLPFTYSWSYTGTAHLVAPFSCNGRLQQHSGSCRFLCQQPYSDHITMHVSVSDANGAFLGSASANAICDGSAGDG
ncbi:hypothetical protein QMK61_01650 [Fulvimonas sp. R45]|uniref:hypothetical protein n=1 Tax=Fulvimonas sp. R45 TaxID=3045937 RepID=UPI00265DBB87|nr:hypothetical protein [Fulvimonas sp. R45]MDO1527522.1 hypothetical protein [Fulvimonas sp. R45]